MPQVSIGQRVFIPRIIITPSEPDFPFVLRRKQFPIHPAYCITINKGQGQSLESVVIILPSPDAIYREVFKNHNINPSRNDTMDLSQMNISLSEISFSIAD